MALAKLPAKKPPVSGTFCYLKWTPKYVSEKPYYYMGPLNPEDEHLRTNLIYENGPEVNIQDLRGNENALRLARHGIQFLKCGSEGPNDLKPEEIPHDFLDKISRIVKQELHADTTIVYDYRFRKNFDHRGNGIDNVLDVHGGAPRPDEPVNIPHIDQTLSGGFRRAEKHFTVSEAKKYLGDVDSWRIRILNVWRPLKGPVKDAPLAFCDYFSVDKSDLVASDRLSSDYVGEVYYLQYNSGQRWYWLSDQMPDEVVMFMSFDTHPGTGAAFCPHASFSIRDNATDVQPRESLEARIIVVNKRETV